MGDTNEKADKKKVTRSPRGTSNALKSGADMPVVMSYRFRGATLPESLQESLNAYADTGRPTGGFLEACIDNDLRAAVLHADETSFAAIPAIVGFLYNEMPSGCWGKQGAFSAWVERKHAEREEGKCQTT